MKPFNNRLWLLAFAAGIVLSLAALPAFAVQSETEALESNDTANIKRTGDATDLDSSIINGQVNDGDDTDAGRLSVWYTKTNGTVTNAALQSTQDTDVEQDTVMGTPAGNLLITLIDDADSDDRRFETGLLIGGYAGRTAVGGFQQAETFPHRAPPEAGETPAGVAPDSVPTVIIELQDTGVVKISLVNTSNYACTFSAILHTPDTDFNVGIQPGAGGAGYQEEQGDTDKFILQFALDTNSMGNANAYGKLVNPTQRPADTRVATLNAARLAEDAETTFYLRIASGGSARARDTLCVTIVLYPDSDAGGESNISTRFSRINSGRGYVGENDTTYAWGGSQDSVSIFAYIATAVVRVRKTDTIYAPASYMTAVGGLASRKYDTVPGALIVYEIVYDNDGNRRADTLVIIDYLDAKVDLYLDSFYNGVDTYYANGIGVDTRFTHARWTNGVDTMCVVEFSNRSIADTTGTWNAQNQPFSGIYNKADSIADTVSGIRVRWTAVALTGFANPMSLRRDQIDDGTYATGANALDNLLIADGDITSATSSDSGDNGKIIFAVVIR